MPIQFSKQIITLFILPILIFIGFLWLTAHHKMNVTGDGLRYMSMARHVATGKGVAMYNRVTGGMSKPVINHQPLWPITMAGFSVFGVDFKTGTWYLNSILLALNLFLSGYLVYLYCRSLGFSFFIQLFLLFDTTFLKYHCFVLAEPLFFLLTQGTLILFSKYMMEQKKIWLYLTCLTIGLCTLTRYIGITYIASLGFYILLFDSSPLSSRIKKSLVMSFLASCPLALWCIRHFLITNEFYDMSVTESDTGNFYPRSVIQSVLLRFSQYAIRLQWFPDQTIFIVLFYALFVGILGFYIYQFKKYHLEDSRHHIPLIILSFCLIYLLGHTVIWTIRSIDFFPDSMRFLSPIYQHLWCLGVMTLWCLFKQIEKGIQSKWLGKMLILLCSSMVLAWLVTISNVPVDWAKAAHQKGYYGRDDIISWQFVQGIRWFPTPPYR